MCILRKLFITLLRCPPETTEQLKCFSFRCSPETTEQLKCVSFCCPPETTEQLKCVSFRCSPETTEQLKRHQTLGNIHLYLYHIPQHNSSLVFSGSGERCYDADSNETLSQQTRNVSLCYLVC